MYYNNYNFPEYRAMEIDKQKAPETVTNALYTPAFLRQHLGKLVRVEFLIGTTYLEDRTRNISRGGRKLYCASIYTRRKSSVLRYLFNKICYNIREPFYKQPRFSGINCPRIKKIVFQKHSSYHLELEL